MLTTVRKTIKTSKDSVEGVKETSHEVEIGTNEPLDEVPERLDEVAAIVDDLIANDAAFRALDIYQQAEDLELGLIFGTLPGGTKNCHFKRDDYLALLTAKRDGVLEDVKAVAVSAKVERLAAEVKMNKPVDEKIVGEIK